MSQIRNTLKKVGINTFFFLLIGMIVLAKFFPSLGTSNGPLPLKEITAVGISVIFFFYGVKLSPQKLKEGLRNWKLHVLIQTTTFLIFPIVILLLYQVFGNDENYFWLGTFYLAALPSTVSSSVVMVSIAKGNLPAAIFNASISSMVGIFITPIWMDVMLPDTAVSFDLTETFIKLSLQVLFPVIIGLFLHSRLISFVNTHAKTLKNFDQGIILLIIFTAFAESFAEKMFEGHSATSIVGLGALMLLLFILMALAMWGLSRVLKFSREDTITVIFCGSKKSLVQGAVMGRVMFPDPVIFGLILLPLMIYHALQLMAGSALAQRLAIGEEKQGVEV
ncbi:bile acid:sodium symporter family protein [Mongoliitalea daihaiensis]|uniref:bile acid:sodium symporter family protein n=1 Tax=Mongoliitalea daihaiensis TaxID=2782006 RepID=UPI001F177E44|nr:bile acid:sodium symporter family protein [Mongoliitalea daihaiensis]UJP64137.1 bile acid:sodium symporter [Mongoliitalea daihaiensis]